MFYQQFHLTYGQILALAFVIFVLFQIYLSLQDSKNADIRDSTIIQENARGRAEAPILRDRIKDLEAEVRRKDNTLLDIRRELAEKQRQLSAKERALIGARSTATSQEVQITNLQRKLATTQEEFNTVSLRQQETAELLAVRTEALTGAEVFLTKADEHSGADIITMLATLNSEIHQTAAMFAEAFTFRSKVKEDIAVGMNPSPEEVETHARTGEIIGSRMAELLRTLDHSQDPTVVQHAFQAGLAAYAHRVAMCWVLDEPKNNSWIAEIYERLRKQEQQTVSGRWRALTRSYIQEFDSKNRCSAYIVNDCANIPLSADTTSTRTEISEILGKRYSNRIDTLNKYALKLKKAIGQDFTSCDFETVYVGQDAIFDAEIMDDTEGLVDQEKGVILCTTELGLRTVTRKPGSNKDVVIVIKPKVVLQSGIDIIRLE